MEDVDYAEVEIDVTGPSGIGMVYWADPIEGMEARELIRRSMPTADEVGQVFLLIKNGAAAATAVVLFAAALKKLFTKHPGLRERVHLRVRIGAKIRQDDVSTLREVGCEVEFVRESVERFEACVDTLPSRSRAQRSEGVKERR